MSITVQIIFSWSHFLSVLLLSNAVCFSPSLDSCDGPLLSALPLASFESSSHAFDSQAPHFAKLTRRDGEYDSAPMLLGSMVPTDIFVSNGS